MGLAGSLYQWGLCRAPIHFASETEEEVAGPTSHSNRDSGDTDSYSYRLGGGHYCYHCTHHRCSHLPNI